MATAYFDLHGSIYPSAPATRGYHMLYREREVNHCPGCGRTHWLVGRLLAECAFCATALPLESANVAGNQFRRRGKTEFPPLAA